MKSNPPNSQTPKRELTRAAAARDSAPTEPCRAATMPRASAPPSLDAPLLAEHQQQLVQQQPQQAQLQSGTTASKSLGQWLAAIQLERYAATFEQQGYDALVFLKGMDEGETRDLIVAAKMPTPHARVFLSALSELQAQTNSPQSPMPPAALVMAEPAAQTVYTPCDVSTNVQVPPRPNHMQVAHQLPPVASAPAPTPQQPPTQTQTWRQHQNVQPSGCLPGMAGCVVTYTLSTGIIMGGITIAVFAFGGGNEPCPPCKDQNAGGLVAVCLFATVLGVLVLCAGLPNRVLRYQNPSTGEERLCFPDRHPNARCLWGIDD